MKLHKGLRNFLIGTTFLTLGACFSAAAQNGNGASEDAQFYPPADPEFNYGWTYKAAGVPSPVRTDFVGEIDSTGRVHTVYADNADKMVHIASLAKLVTAAAFYFSWEKALEEAGTPEDKERVNEEYSPLVSKVKIMLVYSNNMTASNEAAAQLGRFLSFQDLDFIRNDIDRLDIGREGYEVLAKSIVPGLLREAGIPETDIMLVTPNGLPPYAFGRYAEKYRPFNYKGTNSSSYSESDYSRAKSAAMSSLAGFIAARYPDLHEITGLSYITVRGTKHFSTVRLLASHQEERNREHATGRYSTLNPQESVITGKSGRTRRGVNLMVTTEHEINGKKRNLVIMVAGFGIELNGDGTVHRSKWKPAERNCQTHVLRLMKEAVRAYEYGYEIEKPDGIQEQDTVDIETRDTDLELVGVNTDSLAGTFLVSDSLAVKDSSLVKPDITFDSVTGRIDSLLSGLFAGIDNGKRAKKQARNLRDIRTDFKTFCEEIYGRLPGEKQNSFLQALNGLTMTEEHIKKLFADMFLYTTDDKQAARLAGLRNRVLEFYKDTGTKIKPELALPPSH